MDQVTRGDLLAEPGYIKTTYMIDARMHMLPDAPAKVTNRTRVHLHLGPREVLRGQDKISDTEGFSGMKILIRQTTFVPHWRNTLIGVTFRVNLPL